MKLITILSGFIALLILPNFTLAIKCPPGLHKDNRYLGGCKGMTNSWIVKDFLCETHAGSPFSKDVLEASNVLRSRGKGDAQCSPETQGESQCRGLWDGGNEGRGLCEDCELCVEIGGEVKTHFTRYIRLQNPSHFRIVYVYFLWLMTTKFLKRPLTSMEQLASANETARTLPAVI
ncbi:hypothetical protein P167DRAFT_546407 [Morchella conica CCBAS932]|uniref:Uncharacterized protein n=1 Tax=Morchella conica CCBAS932 TaxID=1392247 RepID=A0A3N4KPE1_9PEZI|nr:hypothetical protein P167DRAFT_546407 [Morchella conica CCBAS932]